MFAVMLATATSCFASGSSSLSFTDFIIGIFYLVIFIISLIYFVKTWCMTNDVNALKYDVMEIKNAIIKNTTLESKSNLEIQLRENLVLGKIEQVKQILLQNFVDNIRYGYEKLKANRSHEYILKQSIRLYVENLQKQFDKIGETLPVYIQRMETYGDYINLFTKEDLIVNIEKGKENQEV